MSRTLASSLLPALLLVLLTGRIPATLPTSPAVVDCTRLSSQQQPLPAVFESERRVLLFKAPPALPSIGESLYGSLLPGSIQR